MNDMTVGNPIKKLLIFMIPVFLGNLFQNFYGIVDTIIVGRYLGVDALAAVGAIGPLMYLIMATLQGLTGGFGLLIAQAFGAKEEKLLKHYVAMSSILCVGIVVIFTGVLLISNDAILRLIHISDDIYVDTHSYITIIYVGLFATVLYNMVAAIARALGDSKTPLYFLILSSVLNVVLDIWFIGYLELGVKGAAAATVIAQGISGILSLAYVYRKYKEIHFNKKDAKMDGGTCKRLLGLGLPMALQYSVIGFGGMFVQAYLNQLGTVYIAALSTSFKIDSTLMQGYMALGVALANYVGQNFGAGEIERVRKGVKYAALISMGICACIMIVAYCFAPMFIRIFVSNPSQELQDTVVQIFHIVLWFYPVHAMVIIGCNALQGLEKGIVTMFSGVGELVARCGTILLLFTSLGFKAVCIAEPAAWCMACLVVVPSYLYYHNKLEVMYAQKSHNVKAKEL